MRQIHVNMEYAERKRNMEEYKIDAKTSGVRVGSRTGFPHDRSGTANMIRVTVRENQVLEFARRTAQPS